MRSDVGVSYPIGPDTAIGRSSANDMVLVEPSLSREHARITWRSGRWYIEDCASRNGTVVNGERLPFARPRVLRAGDRVMLGSVPFTFVETADPAQPADADRTGTLEMPGLSRRVTLSEYQQQVLRALCGPWLDGREPASNVAIASELGTPLAVDAVKAALRRVYAKFGLSDVSATSKRRALCEAARNRGMV